MFEVEIVAEVDDFIQIKNKLQDLNAKFLGKQKSVKIFYKSPHDLTMIIYPEKTILRLKPGKIQTEIPLVRKELEVEIENPEEMHSILLALGFHVDGVLKRFREKYKLDETEISLTEDVIKTIELEKIVEKEEGIEEIRNELTSLMKKLGIKELLTKERLKQVAEEYKKKHPPKDEIDFKEIKKFLES